MLHPLLNLGLIGFAADQRDFVATQLALNAVDHLSQPSDVHGNDDLQHAIWQVTDFREADALLVNGERISYSDVDDLRFHMAVDGTDIVGIRPSELTLPYAISGNMTPDVAAIVTQRAPNTMLYDQRSVIQTLQYFEASLRPLRTLYALATQVQERRHEIDTKHTYHLERNGVLDAIIDVPNARVMVRDGLRPFHLDEANWLTRPMSANSLPPQFSVFTMEELAWLLGMHRPAPTLAERYYTQPVYLRRMPRVRSSLLYPRHAVLLQWLSQQGCKLELLVDAMGLHPEVIVRDLHALYMCRAITTTVKDSLLAAEAGMSSGAGASPTADSRMTGQDSGTLPAQGEGFDLPTMAGDLR
jgi:hypothetical protein